MKLGVEWLRVCNRRSLAGSQSTIKEYTLATNKKIPKHKTTFRPNFITKKLILPKYLRTLK